MATNKNKNGLGPVGGTSSRPQAVTQGSNAQPGNSNALSTAFRPVGGGASRPQAVTQGQATVVRSNATTVAPQTFKPVPFSDDFDTDTNTLSDTLSGFDQWDGYLSYLSGDATAKSRAYERTGLEADYLAVQNAVAKYQDEYARYASSITAYQQSVDDYRQRYAGKLSLQEGDFSMATADDAAYFRDSYQKQLEAKQQELADAKKKLGSVMSNTGAIFSPAGVVYAPNQTRSKETDALEQEIAQLQGVVNYYSDVANRMSEEGFDKSRRDWIERGYDLDDQYGRFVENKKTAGTYTYRGERKALEKESRDLHLRLDGLDGRGAVSEAERTEITQRLTEINEALSALPRASKEVQDDKAAARADDVYTRLTSGYGGLLAAYSDESNGANRDSFVSELEAESRNAAKRWAELTAGTTMAGIGAGSTVADFRDAAEKDFKTLQKQTRAMGGKANAVGEVPVAVVESATAQLVRGVAGVEKMVRDSGAVDYTNISSAPLDALLDFVDDANEHLAEVMTGMSPVEQKLTELGVATVAAIPAAVLAAKTAGLSTASEGVVLFGGESAFWNAVGTATSVLKSQVTNPMFWDSFIQAVGNGYLSALDMGVDFSTASSFALINGYINSYIEIGGGIQTLPKSLRELNETISMDQVIKKYLTSMYEEGLEEVHQGFTERLLQNMLLDADNPGFSMTDPDAVISVYGALEEFMGGAVVSAVLGGAQSFNSFAEAHGVQEVVQRLNTARMTLPEQMRPDALVYTNKTTLAECQDYFTEMLAASIEEQAALINKEKHIPLGKYLSQRKDQRLEKVFTAIEKANKGNTSILAPFASELLEKYGDNIPPQVAIEQGELLARIFDGKYLTDEQLDRLDFDSNIVLELFLRKAGIEYNPRLYDPSDPTMKARIVKSVVDGVNEVRANQAELKAATKQAAEQTAAEVKARTEEHTAEEKVDKSKKLAEGEKERRELAEVAKYEREQPMKVDGLTKEQVFDIVRNRLDGDAAKDLVDKAAFADRWVASERLRVNTRDLDTTQLGRIDAAYERYLADLGLTKAEINAINEVTRDDLAEYKKAAMEKSPVKAKVEAKTEEPAEAPEKETVDERRADDTRGTDAGGRGVDPRLQEDNGGPEGVAGSPERVSEPGREDRVDAAPPRDDVAGGSGVGEAGLPDMAEVSEAAGASPEVRAEVPVDDSADGRGPGGAGEEDRVQEPGGDAGVRNEAPLESPAGGDGSQRRVSLKDLGVRNTTLFEDGEHYTEYEFGSDNADPRYERYAVAASLVRSVANSMGVTNVHFLLSDNGTFYDVDGNHAGAFTDRARRGAGTVLVLLNPANDSTYLQNPIRDAIHELIHALPAGIRRTVVNNALKDMTKEHEARILKLDRYADYAKQGADWKEEFVCDALSMLPMSMQITRFHPAVVESLVGRLPNAIETLDSLYDALESMADMPVPAEARVKPDEYRQLIEDARDDLAALRDERRHGRPTEEESAEMDKVLDVFKTQSQEEKAETPKKPGLLDDFNNLLSDLKAGAETEPEAEESAPAEVPGNPQEAIGSQTVIDKFQGDDRFLSNFYEQSITYGGFTYGSVEAAFQAQKCLYDNDRLKYRTATPAEARSMGRKEKNIRPDWDTYRVEVMRDLLRIKFSDPEMRRRLLATGEAELIEGNNWHDNFWGDCTCNRCKGKLGENMLGKILMEVREELRSESEMNRALDWGVSRDFHEESPEEMRERTRPEPPEPGEAPTPIPGVTEAEVEEIKEEVRKTETAKQEKKTKRKKAKVEANTKTIVAANPAPAIETAEAPAPVQSIQQAVVRANNPPVPSSVNTAPSAGASMRTVGRLFPAGMTWTSERMDSTDTATVTTVRLFQGDTPVYTEEARYPKGRTQLPTAVGSSEDVRARLAKGSPAEQEVDRGDRENDMRTRNRGDGESIIPELEAKAIRGRMETEIQRAIKKAKVDADSPEAAAIRAQIEYDFLNPKLESEAIRNRIEAEVQRAITTAKVDADSPEAAAIRTKIEYEFRHLLTKMIAPTSPVGQLSDAERQRIIKAVEKSKDGEYKYGKTVYTLDNDGRLVATVDMSYLEGGTTSTDTGEDVGAVRAELMRNGNTPVERTVSTGDGVFRTRVYQLRDYTDPITGKTAPRLFATERYTFVEQTRDEQSGAKVRGRDPVIIKTGNYHIDYAHPENSVRDPVAEARDEKLRSLLTRARGLAAAWPGMKERQVAAEDVPISAGRTASGALTSSVDKARQYNEMYNKAYPWFVEAVATVQELYPNDMDMQRAVGSLANMVLMGYADTDTYSRVINALHDQGDTGKQIRAALKQAWAGKPIAGNSESAWKTALDNQLAGFRTAFPGLTFDTQSKNRLPKEFFSYAKVLQGKGTAVRPAGDLAWRPHLESKPGSTLSSADASVLGDVLSLVQDNATQTMETSAELREAESRLADAEAALYDAYDAEYADLLKREYQGDLPEGRADELAREGITDLSAIQEYYSRLTDVAGLNDQLQSAIDLAMESVQAYVEAVGVKGQEGWLDVVDSLSRSILTGEIDAESALEAIVEASNSLNADLANAGAARSTIVYDVTSRAKNLYREKRLNRQYMTVSRETLTEIEQKKADERAANAEDGGLASSKIPLVREYESKIKDWNSIPGSLEADLHEAAQVRGEAVEAIEQTIAEIRRLVDAEEIPQSVVGMLDRLGLKISTVVATDPDVEQVLNGIQYVSDRMFDALVDRVDQQINEAGNDPTEHPAMNALGQLYLDYENYINAEAEQDSLYRTAQYAKRRRVNLVGLDEALNAYMSDREAADWDEYDENERIRRNEEARAESLEGLSEGLASDNGGVDEGLPTEETNSWLDERADTARYDWESGAPVAFSLPITQTDIDVLKRANSEEYQTGLETDIVAAVAEANPGSTENSMTESASTKEKRLEAQRRKMAKEEQALPVSEQATAIARGYYDADGNHIPVDRPLSKAQSDAQSMNDDELLRAFKKQNEEASKRSPTLESPTMEDMSLGAALSDAVHSAYRHAINEYESIDRLSKKQTSAVTATHLVKAVQNANTVAGNIAKTNLISHDGDIIGRSLFDVIFCWEPDPNRKDHQIVNERKQDAFNEYLFLQHHIDRMQVAQKAEDRVSSYYLDHAWLLDLTPEEAANLAQEGNEVVLELVRRVQYRNRVRESQAKGELSKEVLADPEYPERALPVDKALERIRVLENEYQDFADKADAYYKWYDLFMREWAVGTSITEYGYQIMHEMYPHYVPTNRTAMTEVDAAVKRLRMWLNDHPEFRTITNEEAMMRAQGGDAAARKYIELRVAIEESENVIKLGNRPVGGGSFSASDNTMASGKATNEATGSLRTLIPVQDQLLSEVRRLVKMRSTNDLLVNLTKEAMFDTDGSIFGKFLKFDNGFTDTALQRDIAAVTDEDLDSLITIEGTGKNANYYITPWLNGQRMRTKVSKGVYQGLVFITNQTATDPTQEWLRDIQKVGRTVGGAAKQMITGINPSFFLRNPMRDFQTAMANSVAGASFPKYWLQAVNEMWVGSENWLDFYNMGGTNSGMLGNMYQRRLLQPDRKRSAQELATDEASVRERILNAISKPGEYTEELTRFAEYLASIDPARPSVQGLSPAQLRLIGIKNAAEVTVDFTRAGSLGKTLNSFVLYFNPQIQGLDKAIRTVTEQPGYKRLAKLGQLALINGLPVLLGQALLKAMGRWDDWNKLSDYIKANYFCIPVSEDGRRWLRIPRSRDWGQVFGVLTYRLFEEQPWDRENGREGVLDNYFTTSIQANLTPPGIGSAVGLGAIWDIRGNADYAGNAIVPYNLENKSKHLQFDEDSSWQSVAIAQLADKLGAELSPKQLDYIVKSFCGDFYYSLYRFIPATLFVEENDGEVTWVLPKGEEIKETAAASWKSFVDQVVVGAWITDSWKSNQTTTNYYNTLEELETRRQDEGREGSKHDAIYDALMNNNGIGKQIQQIAKEIRELPKGKERDALYIQRNAMMMDAMQFIKDCEDGTIADPVFYAMYHSYGGKIESEAKRLNAYAEDYDFAPTFSRVSYISDPDQKGYRFDLKGKTDEETEEIKDTYVAYCQQEYSKVVLQTMANDEYRDGDSLTKAILLSMAKDQAILNAKEDLAADLRRMGMQSRKSTDNENAVEEKNAKYAFSRMLGESKLSRTTTDEIIRLYDYTEAYAFMPSTYVPSEYTDPDNKRNKYDLSDSDKDQYKSIRDQVTNRVYEIIVTDPAYQALDNDAYKARLLAAARDECTTISRKLMLQWLAENGQSVPKKTEEDVAEEKIDKYFSQMAVSILKQHGITY